jgi:hypothetical protein
MVFIRRAYKSGTREKRKYAVPSNYDELMVLCAVSPVDIPRRIRGKAEDWAGRVPGAEVPVLVYRFMPETSDKKIIGFLEKLLEKKL